MLLGQPCALAAVCVWELRPVSPQPGSAGETPLPPTHTNAHTQSPRKLERRHGRARAQPGYAGGGAPTTSTAHAGPHRHASGPRMPGPVTARDQRQCSLIRFPSQRALMAFARFAVLAKRSQAGRGSFASQARDIRFYLYFLHIAII